MTGEVVRESWNPYRNRQEVLVKLKELTELPLGFRVVDSSMPRDYELIVGPKDGGPPLPWTGWQI